MFNCALCNVVLDEDNQTEEHIIPQAIGGRLKVKNFICLTCNNKFGHKWDCILADQLSFFSTSLNIKREKKLPNHRVKTIDGNEYLKQPDGDFLLTRPTDIVEKNHDGSFNIKIEAKDMKVATNIVNKVCKNNNISEKSKQQMLDSLKHNTVPMNQVIEGEINFGGLESGRSLVKTALAMAFYMGIEIKQCDLALAYLLENETPCFGYYYNDSKDFIYNRNTNIPFHCVHIKACSKLKRIYGYIEYFGTFRIVLSLSSNYKGETIEKTYFIDPINNQNIESNVNLDTCDSEIQNAFNYEIYDMQVYQGAIENLLTQVINKSKENNMVNRLNEAVQKWDNSKTYDQNMTEALAYLKQFFDNI